MNDPESKVSVLLGIFHHTTHMAFMPNEVHRTFYAKLAAAGKAALEKPYEQILECGHKATEHWKAFDAVWTKMQPELLYN